MLPANTLSGSVEASLSCLVCKAGLDAAEVRDGNGVRDDAKAKLWHGGR
jgi:hypothetical protein